MTSAFGFPVVADDRVPAGRIGVVVDGAVDGVVAGLQSAALLKRRLDDAINREVAEAMRAAARPYDRERA